MLKAENVTFQHTKEQAEFRFPDISLKNHENLLILGDSGIGKTTLLHILAGLLKPKNGNVIIENIHINTLSNNQLDTFRGKNIGLVFQNNHAVKSLSVFDNLKARLFFSEKAINIIEIESLLTELGLENHKNKKVHQLSEGQLQRLGIALSIIHHPKVILADEPTSSLDDKNCKIVIDLLIQQATKNNANLIVITHDHRIKSFFQNSITL